MLHLFLRISDKLFEMLNVRITQLDKSSDKDMSKNPNLWSLVCFLESVKIRKPFYWENNQYNFRNFNGDERIRIFTKIRLEEVFPKWEEAETIQKVWDNFYSLFSDFKYREMDADEIKIRTQLFFDEFRSISFEETITPYTHIFVSHLFQQIDNLGRKRIHINSFSMQGVEKLNDFVTKYYQRSSNKKAAFIKQVLQKRSRIEVLNHHNNIASILNI